MKKTKMEMQLDIERLGADLDIERKCTLQLKWELNLQKAISKQIYERLEKLVAALEIERANTVKVDAEMYYSKQLLSLDTYKGK